MSNEIPPRLRWACRRGMLELDVLLGAYLDEVYITRPEEEKVLFFKLLECNDQELFNWLTGKEKAPDPAFAKMVESIRYHAEHRHRS